jgi:hypothetical protein
MAEWLKAAVLKTVDALRYPGVRIPLSLLFKDFGIIKIIPSLCPKRFLLVSKNLFLYLLLLVCKYYEEN